MSQDDRPSRKAEVGSEQRLLQARQSKTSERGLVLDRAVSVGDVLLDIPYHHTICVERLTQEYPTLRGIVQELSQRVVTADAKLTVSTPIQRNSSLGMVQGIEEQVSQLL